MITSTSLSLLERLRQPNDQQAWGRFVALYTPVIYSWARQVGAQESDAADLVQDVFSLLLQKIPEFVYDPRGRFRAWLKTLTLNKWRDKCRRTSSRREDKGPLPDVAAANEQEAIWEAEYRQQVVSQALRVMQTDFEARTWQACWATVVDGQPAALVAERMGISVGTVYAAKCRVLARLREELAGLLD